jgi:hypothetical protein
MNDSTVYRDYVNAEVEYRFDRIRSEFAGRRARRLLGRRNGDAVRGDLGDTTFTTVR